MTIRPFVSLAALAILPFTLDAQKPPAVRSLGPIERVSSEKLGSVLTVVALPDGRVFANDVVERRVLLFDSTLANGRVVADSTGATSNAYGARPGVLIRFRADTALFMDPASQSLLVLSPAGKIDRIIAAPQPGGAPFTPNLGGLPGVDAQGRLIYYRPFMPPPPNETARPGRYTASIPDTAFIVRYDFGARTLDTVSRVKIPWPRVTTVRDDDLRMTALEMTPDLFPMIDEWSVAPDGSIAIVRGRDYHVDWLRGDGKWTSTPKMPFEWQRLDDAKKTALIDSGLAAIKKTRDSMSAALAARGVTPISGGGGGGEGGRGGGRGGGGGAPSGPGPALIDGRPTLNDLPDYRPPFTRGAARFDADGNLWVRTTILEKGQPVYDIINPRGEVTDRVVLPPFRTVAGFGPRVIYLAVKDSAGVVHLERARIK
jgi:hypothetical protein